MDGSPAPEQAPEVGAASKDGPAPAPAPAPAFDPEPGPASGREAGAEPGPASGREVGSAAGTEVGAPPAAKERPDERGHRGVAVLLGAAAILAAMIGARATALSSEATDAWQSALRTEVKRSAAALEDIRYLYQAELPPVAAIIGARLEQEELRAAGAAASGSTQQALTLEADAQSTLLGAMEPSYELATIPDYALAAGGVNLGKRLAELRATRPDLVALDPDALQALGDAQAGKARGTTSALLPIGICALLAALAQPFARRRRLLLAAGTVALAIGALVAVGAELAA